MTQHCFNDTYFNLMVGGLCSTTQTWEGLKNNADKDGIVEVLDWEIDVNTKIAYEVKYVEDKQLSKATGYKFINAVRTGKTSQLL